MRPVPYIGVTGFSSRQEVDRALAALPEGSRRPFMVGVLASGKTLRGEANERPRRYPKKKALAGIFPEKGTVLNLLHFSTQRRDKLLDYMLEARDLVGDNCHGFQLNVPNPDARALEGYKARFPDATIVLQCGMRMIASGNAFEVGRSLKRYEGLADYILVDSSGGRGWNFNADEAHALLYCIRYHSERLGLALAGGLRAGNLGRLRPLLERFDFGIDAEGGLRDPKDRLDATAVAAYIRRAVAVLGEYETHRIKSEPKSELMRA